MIYFDNAATSWPKAPGVSQAMAECLEEYGVNPGRGSYALAERGARVIFATRRLLAELFGAPSPDRIIFTSGATEALNLALKGILRPGDHVITSLLEHNAVLRPLRGLARRGVELTFIPCSPEGELDPAAVEAAIRPHTRLLVFTHASNVLGAFLPIPAIAAIARRHGLLFLLDAAQTAGVYPIDVQALGVDLLAFPGHKGLLGPPGIGGLYVRPGLELEPLIEGGTGTLSEQEEQPRLLPEGYESGTMNLPGIAGLRAALEFLRAHSPQEIRRHEEELARQFVEGVRDLPGVKLYGPWRKFALSGPRTDSEGRGLPGPAPVVSLNLGEEKAADVSQILDQVFGIATRAGLHCAPAVHRLLGTLTQGTVRFSFGYANTAEEVAEAVAAVTALAREL